ncbi:MAG TPA: transglutaminase-like domain-containing protein [Burkholderiales bacterium]
MNAPPLFVGAALAFWGWQTGHLVVGLALGAALEALRALKLRIDLGSEQHASIADLSTVGFVLLAVLLAANRDIGSGILQAFIWMPVALSPILAAQLVTRERRIPLSALFRYMRKLRRENPAIKDPPVDVSAVYGALALLSAGVANQRGPEYYAGVVAGAACLLYAALPSARRDAASLSLAAAMLAAAAALGYAGHVGLQQAQLALFDWVLDFNLRSVDTDPYRVRTELGSVGRLKKYDAIVLRVYAEGRDAAEFQLLHRSSYNTYVGGTWVARGARMENLESLADNETWILQKTEPGATLRRVRMSSRFEAGRATLPLPPGTTRLAGFPAAVVERNALGSVHAKLGVDWANYEALGVPGIAFYAPPGDEDLAVPAEEHEVLARTVAELGLAGLPPAERLRRIERHLAGFDYTTFRERAVPPGETALGDFLARTRKGHCEYFATAATLLARAAGVPARYATGYAAIEYSALEGAWVIRTRHSHAWTRAWVDGGWIDVDTTPAVWGPEEASEAPLWQGLADLLRYAGFRWSQRGEFRAGDGWYAVLALLAVYLGWSVLRGRRVVREQRATRAARRAWPGEDSEFYALEKTLPARESSETQAAWLRRIAPGLPPETSVRVATALQLHQRYRFDPDGLTAAERGRLRELCAGLAAPG